MSNINVIFRVLSFIIFKEIFAVNEMQGTETWTSCEQFLDNTTFDLKSVVDIDWKIFYFWNYETENSYHIKFSHATTILVDRFKVELQKLDATINWAQAVLFMETSIDFSALYMETEVSGKFRLIPSIAFQLDAIPKMIFAMKLVEPGYLGIMNCQKRVCYALAPVGQLPEDKDLQRAAEKIGFYGDQNRSYLYQYDPRPPLSPYLEDDSEEDEQVEIDNEPLAYEL